MLTKNQLIINYLPLAKNIARNYSNQSSYEEIKSIAFYALVKAAHELKHNENYGSYFKIKISGAIKDYFKKNKRYEEFKSTYIKSNNYIDEVNFNLIIDGLDETSKKILMLFFKEEFTLREIGDKLNLKKSNVFKLLCKAKESLKCLES